MLPVSQTTFIGRDSELNRARTTLLSPSCRMLTMIGPGGTGKTRLALQLARDTVSEFADGAYFVDLQQIDAPDLLLPKIAETLRLNFVGSSDLLSQIIESLKEKSVLLLIDNFEGVTASAVFLSAILNGAASVKMLVTSREALRLQEEHLFTLHGLPIPDENAGEQEIMGHSSVQLFFERARQIRPDFRAEVADVAAICRLVEGSPLAIELAAGWAKMLDSGAILEELRTCIDFLSSALRNIPERHRSIRATFNGSWIRLTDSEQSTLRRLSVFRSGFDRAAAESIAQARLVTLSALIDKSLLTVSAGGRYSMHELIRQYAHEKLEERPDEYESTHTGHSEYYAALTETQSIMLRGHRQVEALKQIQQDIHNIRAGWVRAVQQAAEPLLERYMLGLALYYQMQSRGQEAVDLFTLTPQQSAQLSQKIRARLNLLCGWTLVIQGRNHEGIDLTWRALETLTVENSPFWLGMVLVPATHQPEILGDRYQKLTAFVHQSLAHASGDWHLGWLQKTAGEIAAVTGDTEQAIERLKTSAVMLEHSGDLWSTTWALGSLGQALSTLKRYAEAEHYYQLSEAICHRIGDISGVIDIIHKSADAALAQSHYDRAETLLMNGFKTALKHRVYPNGFTYLLDTFVQLREAQKRHAEAAEYLSTLIESALVQKGWRAPEVDRLRVRLRALKAILTPADYDAAMQRGTSADLIEKVAELLNQYSQNQSTQTASDHKQNTTRAVLREPLTEREIEILRLIAAGKSNRQIADLLTLSLGTIKTHAHNIYGKLGAVNRTEATLRAQDLDLV